MEILSTKILAQASKGSRIFLSLVERTFSHKGRESSYFFAIRGDTVGTAKRPDAVVIVAVTEEEEPRLVLTSEFRIPIGCREISFPAGIIDKEDFAQGSVRQAAIAAATRELKEETGLDFHPMEVSPANLYSSAGMTNESVTFVFGKATGSPSTDGNEAMEDIEVRLVTLGEMIDMMDNQPDLNFSKTAWPLMWAYKRSGGFFCNESTRASD